MPDQAGGPRILLGVAGGIAAYKAVELLRLLTESGHAVRVLPTENALRFVGAATWAALSGSPVSTGGWDQVESVPHVRLGREADLVLVAPATADLLARAAGGRADDLLTATLLTARCPVVLAPAMHTEMWQHPATRANVALLRQRGVVVLEPAVGRLTGADSGVGRLPDPTEIAAVACRVLARGTTGTSEADLAGRRVVVSAGGTREYLDPVRFLGNRSSGRQGLALARTAAARGAEVTVIAANVALPDPAGVKVVPVVSAEDLRAAVVEAAVDADAVVMAAAVADFRPAQWVPSKIKKGDADPAPLALTRTPDVLAELASRRLAGETGGTGSAGAGEAGAGPPEAGAAGAGPVLVGFAAETDDVLAHGRAKLAAKGCDLLVVNRVGDGVGFEVEVNAAVVLGADGTSTDLPLGSKDALADAVWDLVVARLQPG